MPAIEENGGSSEHSSNPDENSQSHLEVATASPEIGPSDVETGAIPMIELPATNESLSVCDATANSEKGSVGIAQNIEAIAVIEPGGGEGGMISTEDLESAPIAQLVEVNDKLQMGDAREQEATTNEDQRLERRPEFASATLHKSTEDTPMGMGLACQDGEVLISSIIPGSLVSKTPFCVGDRLLSVNAKRCYIMDSKSVAQFMATLVGSVTIVVHNKTGDPNLVESMVTRPTIDSRCGLGLKSSGRRNLKISSIDHDGLFFESLLNVGDPLVSINGEDCRCCDAQGAGEKMRTAGKFITIKAETLLETGVVVAAFSCNNSTGSAIPPQIQAAFNQIDNLKPSMAQLIALIMLALSLVGLLLITGFM